MTQSVKLMTIVDSSLLKIARTDGQTERQHVHSLGSFSEPKRKGILIGNGMSEPHPEI